jgi:short-subunit dehydrogenase
MNTLAIVGAGPGISQAVARQFARHGFRVALVARNTAKLQGLQQELTEQGFEAHSYPADAADLSGLTRTLERIGTDLGAPDVLVYNANSSGAVGAAALEPETLEQDFRVNVSGALAASQAVLPGMIAAGRGTVLFTGGGLALHPSAQYASLSIGKAGLRSLALCLAQELEGRGVHVATVTVAGSVQPGTAFDPDKIAAHYWRLHTQERGSWEAEHVFRGEP